MGSSDIYWKALKSSIEQMGGTLISASELDIITPSTLPMALRVALHADIEERIRANNNARNESYLKAAHIK